MWLAERIWEPYLARIINEFWAPVYFFWMTRISAGPGLDKKGISGILRDGGLFQGRSPCFPIKVKHSVIKYLFPKPAEAIALLKKFSVGKKKKIRLRFLMTVKKFGLWPAQNDYWVCRKDDWLGTFKLIVKNEKYYRNI